MAAQTQIGIRLPADLLDAIDALAAADSRPGDPTDRSAEIRALLYTHPSIEAEIRRQRRAARAEPREG